MNKFNDINVFLLSFKTRGIKNIEKMITLDFYKTTITKSFDKNGYNIKAIYGENGVGKSGIITAVKIYRDLMTSDRYLKDPLIQNKLSNLVNKNSDNAFFESTYIVEKNNDFSIYTFGIEIGKNNGLFEIVKEYCYRKKTLSSKPKMLYEVNNGVLTIYISSEFDSYVEDISKNLLKESSLLGVIANRDIDDKYKNEMSVFEEMYLCHLKTYVYLTDKDKHGEHAFKEMIRNTENTNADILKRMVLTETNDYISCGRSTIVDKNDFERFLLYVKGVSRFIRIFKPELISIELDKKENRDIYECELLFNYGEYRINGEYESTGIKKLVELYTAFDSVNKGCIVFIDELDANIHDYYLCKLLEYVGEYSNGQLCFTTHNLGPMKVLKKYKKSIDFLSRDGSITPWIKNGNYDVSNLYSKGLIDKSPFNLDAFDFLGVFTDR